MDRNIKSSFTLLQNKLSNNDEIIIITSKFVLFKNKTHIKDINSWKEFDEDEKSFIKSLGLSKLQDLEGLKKENEELKKVIYELKKEKDEELEEIELTQKFSQLKVKNDTSQVIHQKEQTHSQGEGEFSIPSPIIIDLTENDFLSEEEAPVQNKPEEYNQCPYCKKSIPFPLPKRIREYLIKRNPSAQDNLSDKIPSLSIFLQHSLNVVDQFEFCRVHEAEINIVPEGLKKGYPINIEFDKLFERVENLIPELNLIIMGERKSLYREVALNAYRELGRTRARKPTILMGRFHNFLPGYYGSKGIYIISSSLVSLLLETNILTKDMTNPLVPLEYINQILVPEIAIMLISQDFGGISFEDAKNIMEDSIEFGMYVHDIENE